MIATRRQCLVVVFRSQPPLFLFPFALDLPSSAAALETDFLNPSRKRLKNMKNPEFPRLAAARHRKLSDCMLSVFDSAFIINAICRHMTKRLSFRASLYLVWLAPQEH